MSINIDNLAISSDTGLLEPSSEHDGFERWYAALFQTYGAEMDTQAVADAIGVTRSEVLKSVRGAVSEEEAEQPEHWARLLAFRHARIGHKFYFQTSAVALILAEAESLKEELAC